MAIGPTACTRTTASSNEQNARTPVVFWLIAEASVWYVVLTAFTGVPPISSTRKPFLPGATLAVARFWSIRQAVAATGGFGQLPAPGPRLARAAEYPLAG